MSLDVSSVCRIIETCSKAGVTKLSFEGLTVELGGKEIPAPAEVIQDIPEARTQVEAEEIARSEVLVKEDQVANLILEDPARYEELMAQGELTDERAEETEND